MSITLIFARKIMDAEAGWAKARADAEQLAARVGGLIRRPPRLGTLARWHAGMWAQKSPVD